MSDDFDNSYRQDAFYVGRWTVTLFMVVALPVVVAMGIVGGVVFGPLWLIREWWWSYLRAVWTDFPRFEP